MKIICFVLYLGLSFFCIDMALHASDDCLKTFLLMGGMFWIAILFD